MPDFLSTTFSVHVPLADLPLNADSGLAGLKAPEWAPPEVSDWAAESSKVVAVLVDGATDGADAGEVGDELIGDGRATAGDQIVPGAGTEAVVAGGDVVEVGGGERVERGQRLAAAVERRQPGDRAALVGDG